MSSSLLDLIEYFEKEVQKASDEITLVVTKEEIEKFGYGSLVDLGNRYEYRFLTPKVNEHSVELLYQRLDTIKSFHNIHNSNEKYGVQSRFFQIEKNDKFAFIYYFREALKQINIQNKKSVLNLGINKADEFDLINSLYPKEFDKIDFTGIDFSSSAIEFAKNRFDGYKNINFICADINGIDSLNLGRFDCMISIGTLQSSTMNLKTTIMDLVQKYLEESGSSIILGFPNCRWIENEMIYGARVPNYSFSELGTVMSDIMFCKKYLQQKKFRVMITGKEYLFLTAVKIV